MVKIKSSILSNYYQFNSYGCECLINPNINDGNNKVVIKLDKDKKYNYAFAPEYGLVKIGINGTIIDNNVIGQLLGTIDNPERIRDFFNNNCFFTQFDDYIETDYRSVFSIVYSLKIIIDLMIELSENDKDYIKIYKLIISRLLIDNEKNSKNLQDKIYKYNFIEMVNNISDTVDQNTKNVFETKCIEIYNEIENKNDNINIDIYNKINSGNFNSDVFYNKILFAYCNYHQNTIYKKVFNLIKNVSDTYGHIDESLNFISKNTKPFLSNNTKIAIINIAKELIKNDMDYNIKNIHPEYNGNDLTPSWRIDDFLSAIFFSIFYINPELQIYRKCANIHCNQYFLVDTTSKRRKYCSTECRNQSNVNKYRTRHNKK